jgi:MoaA/NifB/PqqE/SkfB family radical SAM enzyme
MTTERQYVIQGRKDWEADRIAHAATHMATNKAYLHAVEREGGDPDGKILADFIDRFRAYRAGWRENPKRAIREKLHDSYVRKTGNPPMCVDIEVAAVCDLACAFCYRQWIATPDKLMDETLCYRLIDECAEMGVPSVKFTWRGETLLHPMLPKFVDYAKRAGVLETLVTTDAVTLTEETSRALVEAGLDVLVYSFDGGNKETYEKMRVGRFHENKFEDVYENIRRFARIRSDMESQWPITKIQMILTQDTFKEQDEFEALFSDCVDDVSVKAYTERGGRLEDLDPAIGQRLETYLDGHALPRDSAHWRDMDGNIFVAHGRLACEQPFQRLMVAYDGTVCMCCYDWGTEYPIGFVDERALISRQDYEDVVEKTEDGAKGFVLLANVKMPKRYPVAPAKIQTLKEIWDGVVVNDVRRAHVEGKIESVPICTACPFKETYAWEQVPNDS